MAARVAALFSLLACVALGFAPHHAPLHRHVLARPTAAAAPARRGAPLMALGVFARKAKEAQIAPLKGAVEAGGAEHPIGARMAAARTGALLDAPAEDGGRSVDERGPAKFVEALRRGPKTIAVISEYRRNVVANAGGYISEVPPPNIMSSSFRGAGSAACSVLMDPVVGNCTQSDFDAYVIEQATAKRDYPGPLPLVWNDIIVDEVQIAQASVARADGVTLLLGVLGGERAAALAAAAATYGLAVFTQVSSAEEIALAIELEIDEFIVLVGHDINGALGLFDDFNAPRPSGEERAIRPIWAVPCNEDQALTEAEDAWLARDAGFGAVWVSEVLFKFGGFSGRHFKSSPDNAQSVITAMRSKGSVSFGSAGGAYTQQGEGAREYLGDLLM